MKTIIMSLLFCSVAFAQSYPGSFSRIGLNAKGMALGNSISAMPEGNVYTYYNPALASFQMGGSISGSVALMSLGRQLNVITYTQGLRPGAGMSLGLINANVTNIDGRDADGAPTGNFSTSEYLAYFSFSNEFFSGFSVGVNLKMYYNNLYSGLTSTALGFDIGALYRVTNDLSLGAVVTDLGVKYHWDSSNLYGTDGSSFTSPFPHIVKLGASYDLPIFHSCVTAEYDIAPGALSGIRAGLEVSPIPLLALRAGLYTSNQLNLGTVVTPSFGFGAKIELLDFAPEINYAYVFEPYTPYGIQTISLMFGF